MTATTFARRAMAAIALLATQRVGAQGAGRALQIEDFYRIRTAAGPAVSPNGRWVAFTVSTRDEATNRDPSEVWLVPADGGTPARRVSAEGQDASGLQWGDDNRLGWSAGGKGWVADPGTGALPVEGPMAARRGTNGGELSLTSPDGRQTVHLRNVASPRRDPAAASEFERRHEARFKGVQFDWLDFQRDGQPFPVPNRADPAVSPSQELFVGSGDQARQLTRLGLRPAGLQWNRDGTALLFTADTAYRSERKYGGAAVYLVTTSGTVRTLTNDPEYSHTGTSFSPDGQRVLYVCGDIRQVHFRLLRG